MWMEGTMERVMMEQLLKWKVRMLRPITSPAPAPFLGAR